jgi:hypothetical protein
MKTKALTATAALVALLLLPGVSHALTDAQEALVGLKGVYVSIEKMAPQAESLGLTQDQIKTDVELRLRKAGVLVLTIEETGMVPGYPTFYVNIGTTIAQNRSFVPYSVILKLIERVTLARGFKAFGAIWDTGRVGAIDLSHITQIRGSVDDLVDIFINDYLAANPKK